VEEVKPVVVVIDSAASVLPSHELNSNTEAVVMSGMLRDLSRELQTTIWVLAHHKKRQQGVSSSTLEKVSGATQLTAQSDRTVGFTRESQEVEQLPDGSRRLRTRVRMDEGRFRSTIADDQRVHVMAESVELPDRALRDLMVRRLDAEEAAQHAPGVRKVLDILRAHHPEPVHMKDIVLAHGRSATTVKRDVDKAMELGLDEQPEPRDPYALTDLGLADEGDGPPL
jgi:hypothetical protein